MKVYQSPRFCRVLLNPNSQSGQQDLPDQEARKSSDHQSASDRCYGETYSGKVDYRIPGKPFSAVEQQDTNRKETVKKLIQQFENHPNKESFVQDLNKTGKIHKFREDSKKLITDMSNTEIFELRFMWEMSDTFAKYSKVRQEELRRLINSRLRHQKEPTPWCQTWSFRTATNEPKSQEHVAESSPTQAWWVQNHVGKMPQR